MTIESKQTRKHALVKAVGGVLLIVALFVMPLTALATELSASATVRAPAVEGALASGYSAHYLAIEPTERDGVVTLSLTVNPQDNPRVANRVNLWVLSPEGLHAVEAGEKPENVAIAAGNPTVLDADADPEDIYHKEASFLASGRQTYTAIVYSRAPVSITYTLVADNAMLIDASGQTKAVADPGGQAKGADNGGEQPEAGDE